MMKKGRLFYNKMTNPKISVIIPVYNVEKYLSECLDSIINQTLKDTEIICVNDGSTDNSLSILKEYASKDDRIKIIDKENEGQGYARKVGLDIATGKYILFCDSDDYYAELTAFEELYNYIEKVKVDVVIFNFIQKNDINKSINYITDYNKYPQKDVFSYLDIDNILIFNTVAWLKIYSKQFFDRYVEWYFPKKIKFEDAPFHYQVLLRAKCSFYNKYLYVYRVRINSTMTMKNFDDKIIDSLKTSKDIFDIIRTKCEKHQFDQFWGYFFSRLKLHLFNYQIKKIETAKYIIETIKLFATSDLLEIKKGEEFSFLKAGLRMQPEQYLDYLNKKIFKNKNKEVVKLKEIKQIRETRIKRLNEQLQQKNETIAKRDEVIKTKNEFIKQKDEQIKTKNEAIAKRDEVIKTKNECIKQKDEQIKTKNECIKQKNNEIQKLHTQTNLQEQVIQRLQNSWSYRIGRLFTYPLSIPLDFYKYIRDYNLIKKSGLFDRDYYLSQNEDVKKSKMDPIKHYLKFGWKEGRNPSSEFDGNEYLNKRPDVRVAGLCPLVHYIKFGKDEK